MSKNQQQKDWYKKTLEKIDNIMSSDKDIADKYLEIYKYTRTALDGEPTTADEYNDVISQYEDHEIQSEIKKVQSEIKNSLSPENTVRISDINEEIAKEWNRDREEAINKEKTK
jgi:hypothetical protein